MRRVLLAPAAMTTAVVVCGGAALAIHLRAGGRRPTSQRRGTYRNVRRPAVPSLLRDLDLTDRLSDRRPLRRRRLDGLRNLRPYTAIGPSYLRLSRNPATGDGGTCYGDSDGPNFLGEGPTETEIIAGITITGDSLCKSTNVTYRLDTESARASLDDYVTLP